MGLDEVEVIHTEVMQAAEGTRVEIKGKFRHTIDLNSLVIPPEPEILSDDEISADIKAEPMKIVAATVGEDEHSVGLREIIDIKHGGIEKFGFEVHYLGTSCPIEKLVDAAIELNAGAIMISTIISHDDIHYKNMKKLHETCVEKGIRDNIILIAGGTQVTPELARTKRYGSGLRTGFQRNHECNLSGSAQKGNEELRRERPDMKADVLTAEIGSTTTVVNAFGGMGTSSPVLHGTGVCSHKRR